MPPAESARLAGLREFLSRYSSSLLGAYAGRVRDRSSALLPKDFNDPVWQTVVLNPLEVAILDSPIVQRLREIRQLGVVHWVYPGATHTRFEHSLGVVHQVQALISTLNSRDPTIPVVSPDWTNLLRIAALLHDVGHGVMSHVSEYALRSRDEVQDLVLDFVDELGLENVKLSELLSYELLGTAAFREFFEIAQSRAPRVSLPANPLNLARLAILGKPIRDDSPMLQELVSGPFDADKLDYLPRDARACGIPIVTDIPRLVQKVRAVQKRQEQLPPRIARQVTAGLTGYWILGVALSGGRTIDELLLGRTLLFDKVYRHQKVRAAEAMVGVVLHLICDHSELSPCELLLTIRDDELLHLDQTDLRRRFNLRESEGVEEALQILGEISRRLRERHLFVRCAAFAQRMTLDPYVGDREHHEGLERLIREMADAPRRNAVRQAVADTLMSILRLHEEEALLREFPETRLASYLCVDPPQTPVPEADTNHAQLVAEDGRVVPFRLEAAEARAWSNAYLQTRDLGFVFCPRRLAPFAYLACERVFREKYGVRLPLSMQTYSKHSVEAVESLRKDLATRGFYDDAPYDLRPLPARLTKADVPGRISAVLEGLQGYDGPSGEGQRQRMVPERFRDWIRQFGEDGHCNLALELLESVRLISRVDIVEAVVRCVGDSGDLRGAFLCPLGEPKDSSFVCSYLAADAPRELRLTVTSLEVALASSGGEPIIFVDDFIGSGKQSVSVLEALLGTPPSFDLGEERQLSLSAPLVETFKQRRLAFAFAAGLDEGRDRLNSHLAALGLNAEISILIREPDLPKLDKYSDRVEFPSFRERCEEVGFSLLEDGNPKHNETWRRERALGYGNRGLLVLFPYNTPTQALTCLWKRGNWGGVEWRPLFPRRKKI